MKFKKGDIVKFEGAYSYSAKKGATAIVENYYIGHDGNEYLNIKWIKNGLSDGQDDGGYFENHFTKVEEVSQQKEDRILKENKKVMKFNFEGGKQRVVKMLEEHIVDFKTDMSKDIKGVINDDREDVIDQIEDIIETIKTNTNYCEKAIGKVKIAKSIAEVLLAMKNTCYEEMEETTLNVLFGLEGITIE